MNEQELFFAAVEIGDRVARKHYLAEACAGDPELLARVEALLTAHEKSGEFLEVPALERLAWQANPIYGSTVAGSEYDVEGDDAFDLSYLESSTRPDAIGRLQHYDIIEVVGQGGFGIVFKAFDQKLERIVALKVMTTELAATSPARKRFLREARVTAAIKHENVVSIFAVEEAPLPFLVMEFIDGMSLQEKINQTGPLDLHEILDISLQIAKGLSAAHAVGLIHRDIKPANILLERGSLHIKITDFGLARSVDDASLTRSGVIAGTPLYMSPEQAQGFRIDQRSDLFSLGSVMYVMTSGRPPFRAQSSIAVLRRVVEDVPRPIHEIISDVPAWLEAVIAKLHAKQPSERYASAEEVAQLLAACQAEWQELGRVVSLDELVKRFPRESKLQPSARSPWPRRVRTLLGIAGGVGLFAVGRFYFSHTPIDVTDPANPAVALTEPSASVPAPIPPSSLTPVPPSSTPSIPIQDRVFHGHGSEVMQVAFTPDGSRLISASNGDHHEIRGRTRYHVVGADNSIRVWDLATGQSIRQFKMTEGWRYGPQGIALAPDGRTLAVSSGWCWANGPSEPRVYVWDIVTSELKHHLPLPDGHAIRSLHFSSDGTTLSVVRSGQGGIHTWEMPEAKPRKRVMLDRIPIAVEAPGMTWSPDGRWIFSVVWGGGSDFLAWDRETGKVVKTFRGHRKAGTSMAMSPDGKRLLSCSEDYTLRFWDWETMHELHRVGNLISKVTCVAFSADSQRCLCGAEDGSVTLYNATTAQVIQRFEGHEKTVRSVAFSGDGKLAASGGADHTVRVWRLPQ